MEREVVAVGGFIVLFGLMALRVPIGIAMGLVGVGGFAMLSTPDAALSLLALTPIRTATDYSLGLVPMFILMGALATRSGMSEELFRASNAWLGHRKGGLAMATIAACGGFAAICGSSVATAATMANVALPEMRRFGYSDAMASGTIAAGGTLGILIPPSVVLAIYGIITEQDIGRLFIAGIAPGLLALCLYLLLIQILVFVKPDSLPVGERTEWRGRMQALRGVWAILLLFVFVIGGIYGGMFTPTEAAGMGAAGTFLIGVARRRLTWRSTMECLVGSLRTSASIFVVLIGAMLFGYFLAVTQTPQNLTQWLVGLNLGPYGTLSIILVAYILLGCILDAMAMIVLTVPIIFPVVSAYGFDPIWFGVIVVMTVELGLITPPIGMNVFVINSVAKDVSLPTIFRGVLPFVAIDVVRLVVLVAFPAITLFLVHRMG
ncbi:MAG: TRAP transporter large permease [Deferrisomatales bacterium]|nr:TRAP transporter large permease [Deferrisomatales bacterium]